MLVRNKQTHGSDCHSAPFCVNRSDGTDRVKLTLMTENLGPCVTSGDWLSQLQAIMHFLVDQV